MPSPLKNLPVVTVDQWQAALTSAYVAWDTKEGSGQEDFLACFGAYDPAGKPRCGSRDFFKGNRDAFNGSYRFRPALGGWNEAVAQYSMQPAAYVGFGMSMYACERNPAIVAIVRFGGESWLFVDSFSVLADGNLVIRKELSFEDVKRDTFGRGVTERGLTILAPAEISALKTIKAAQSVQVRVTGKNGFVLMSQEQTRHLVTEIEALVLALPKVEQQLGTLSGQMCQI